MKKRKLNVVMLALCSTSISILFIVPFSFAFVGSLGAYNANDIMENPMADLVSTISKISLGSSLFLGLLLAIGVAVLIATFFVRRRKAHAFDGVGAIVQKTEEAIVEKPVVLPQTSQKFELHKWVVAGLASGYTIDQLRERITQNEWKKEHFASEFERIVRTLQSQD